MELDDELLEQAADWYDQLGELTADQRQQYVRWLNEKPEHQAAMQWLQRHYGDHEQVLELALQEKDWAEIESDAMSSAVSSDQEALSHVEDDTSSADESAERTSPWRYPVAMVASLVLVTSIALLMLAQPATQTSLSPATTEHAFLTRIGEQQTEVLDDGSTISLNANTALAVRFAKDSRGVEMRSGEAFFEVARDEDRPFRVEAGGLSVEVLGTAFDVDVSHRGTRVEVQHGRVQVSWQGEQLVLGAEEAVRQTDSGLERYTAMDVASWREGWRRVKAEPLAQTLNHLQRHSDRPIELKQVPNGLTFTGRYRVDDVEGTLMLLASLFELQLHLSPDSIVLSGEAAQEP